MLKEAEPRRIAETDLELLRDLGRRIAPDDPELESWFSSYSEQHRRRLAVDLALVERLAEPGSTVLEYGAVPLLLTAALSGRGWDVSALDVAPGRFATAIDQLGLDVRPCDVETEPVPFAAASFDLVLFNELFEHLRIDPIFTLGEALRVLRPGGRLLLSTPNLRSLRGLRNLIFHDRGHASSGGVYAQYTKLRTLGHVGHVREYTVTEVAEFLDAVGFRVERVVFRGGHGSGLVGLAERLAPGMRPFFTLVAQRPVATDGRQ